MTIIIVLSDLDTRIVITEEGQSFIKHIEARDKTVLFKTPYEETLSSKQLFNLLTM